MLIAIILAAVMGAAAGYIFASYLSAKLDGKTLSAELSAEDKLALSTIRTDLAEVKAKVDAVFHITTTHSAVAASAVAGTATQPKT